jgi:hypothetical protein
MFAFKSLLLIARWSCYQSTPHKLTHWHTKTKHKPYVSRRVNIGLTLPFNKFVMWQRPVTHLILERSGGNYVLWLHWNLVHAYLISAVSPSASSARKNNVHTTRSRVPWVVACMQVVLVQTAVSWFGETQFAVSRDESTARCSQYVVTNLKICIHKTLLW